MIMGGIIKEWAKPSLPLRLSGFNFPYGYRLILILIEPVWRSISDIYAGTPAVMERLRI